MVLEGKDLDRFLAKVNKKGPEGCWLWISALNKGYGQFHTGGRAGRHFAAHRLAYELWVGPIPSGLDLDHTCHNADASCRGGSTCQHRSCVNPAHLEPTTRAKNLRRGVQGQRAKTHCPQNHPYAGDNLYVRPRDGARICRACVREHVRNYEARKRAGLGIKFRGRPST
jgi:hypothetical protein